jgi:thiol:disulfide interchange protein DsbD
VNTTNRIKGGRFISVFVMGALSALIMSPCVAAPLAGALLYIGQTHDVVLGGVALFALSLGMGVPLLVLGASAGAILPKSGPWMNAVRNLFGVVMLGMAVWLIGPVIPAPLQLGLWSALLIVLAIYMHALDGLPPYSGAWAKLWKGVGIILLVTGIALLVGALSGNRNPLQPLAGLRGTASAATHDSTLPFTQIKSLAELESAIKRAQGKVVMLDFYADWCVACKEFEQYTFSDPRVRKLLTNAVLLQADVTQNNADDGALLKRFGLYGPPGIIFFDPQGQEIQGATVVGFQDADKFLVTLNSVYGGQGGECAPSSAC